MYTLQLLPVHETYTTLACTKKRQKSSYTIEEWHNWQLGKASSIWNKRVIWPVVKAFQTGRKGMCLRFLARKQFYVIG
jgi:hypothetical protein